MIKHALKITFGFFLVIIGIIGGLVPIFQGWVFGIPGIIILSNYFPPLKRILIRARAKYKTKKNLKN